MTAQKRRLIWFGGLYLASVATLALVYFVARLALWLLT